MKYGGNNIARCPYNEVMSFIYRYKPKSKENGDLNLLELECGDGNNLWFAAKEGFKINGIEICEESLSNTKKRLSDENLEGNVVLGNFIEIPFISNTMDLVFDRGAVTIVSIEDARECIKEVYRVLKSGGEFYFNPYSEFNGDFLEVNI